MTTEQNHNNDVVVEGGKSEHDKKYMFVWANTSKHTRHELSKYFYPKYKDNKLIDLFTADEHLNNIPLHEFDSYHYILSTYIFKHGLSLSECVCYMKGLLRYMLLVEE